MPTDSLVVLLLVGLVAGFLASHFMAGHGFGILGDLVVGVLGAFLGTWLAAHLGVSVGGGLLGLILVAFVGAMILVSLLRMVMGARGGGYRRRRVF